MTINYYSVKVIKLIHPDHKTTLIPVDCNNDYNPDFNEIPPIVLKTAVKKN